MNFAFQIIDDESMDEEVTSYTEKEYTLSYPGTLNSISTYMLSIYLFYINDVVYNTTTMFYFYINLKGTIK